MTHFDHKKKNPSIDIHTPTVSAGIRGTELVVDITPDQTVLINVLEGRDHLAAVTLTYVAPRGFRFGFSQGYRYQDFDQANRDNDRPCRPIGGGGR